MLFRKQLTNTALVNEMRGIITRAKAAAWGVAMQEEENRVGAVAVYESLSILLDDIESYQRNAERNSQHAAKHREPVEG